MSFFDVWVRWKDKAVRSFRQGGVLGTLKLVLTLIKDSLRRRRQKCDELFDRRFGVDTTAAVVLPELQSDHRFEHSRANRPTPSSVNLPLLTIAWDNVPRLV